MDGGVQRKDAMGTLARYIARDLERVGVLARLVARTLYVGTPYPDEPRRRLPREGQSSRAP